MAAAPWARWPIIARPEQEWAQPRLAPTQEDTARSFHGAVPVRYTGLVVQAAVRAHMNYDQLPPDLPQPVDDGACDHLPSAAMPNITLQSTSGRAVALHKLTA